MWEVECLARRAAHNRGTDQHVNYSEMRCSGGVSGHYVMVAELPIAAVGTVAITYGSAFGLAATERVQLPNSVMPECQAFGSSSGAESRTG